MEKTKIAVNKAINSHKKVSPFTLKIPMSSMYTENQFCRSVTSKFKDSKTEKRGVILTAVNLWPGSDSRIEWNTRTHQITLHKLRALPCKGSEFRDMKKEVGVELANMFGLDGIAAKIKKEIIKV
jgi:hypothetical protein